MDREIWKEIEDSPWYLISSHGRVWSRKSNRILKQVIDRYGYPRVSPRISGKTCHRPPHRLVATAFIPNPNQLPQVDHINEDKGDNRVVNLRWVNQSQNQHNITPLRATNTSGVRGVFLDKSIGMWVAKITVNGAFKKARFKTKDGAITQRKAWEEEYKPAALAR